MDVRFDDCRSTYNDESLTFAVTSSMVDCSGFTEVELAPKVPIKHFSERIFSSGPDKTIMVDDVMSDEYIKKATIKCYTPKRIIYSGPATIVFWNDGTKTVVKCHDMSTYNKYTAFCAALAKKVLFTNSRINRIVNNGIEEK